MIEWNGLIQQAFYYAHYYRNDGRRVGADYAAKRYLRAGDI